MTMQKRPEGVSRLAWTLSRCGRPDNPNFWELRDMLKEKLGAVEKEPTGKVRVIMSLGLFDEPSVLDLHQEEDRAHGIQKKQKGEGII
jgi:hypothetical protein